MGVFASVLIVVFILSRFVPWKVGAISGIVLTEVTRKPQVMKAKSLKLDKEMEKVHGVAIPVSERVLLGPLGRRIHISVVPAVCVGKLPKTAH